MRPRSLDVRHRRPGPAWRVVPVLASLVALLPARAGWAADAGNDTPDASHYTAEADLLATGTWYQRSEAADDLQAAGHRAAAAGAHIRDLLIASIAGHDWRLAHVAAETLAAIAPEDLGACTAPLDVALGGTDQDVRGQALALVPLLGPAGAPLVPRLADLVSTPLGPRAIAALGAIGTAAPGVVPTLQAALDQADEAIVHAAIAAFGTLGPKVEATLPSLVRLLTRPGDRAAVLATLGSFGPAAAAAVPAVMAAEEAAHGDDHDAFASTLKHIETEDQLPTVGDAQVSGGEGGQYRCTPPVADPDDPIGALHLSVDASSQPQLRVQVDGLQVQVFASYGWSGEAHLPMTVSDGSRSSRPATLAISLAPDTAPAQLVDACRSADGHLVVLGFDRPMDAVAASDVRHVALGRGVQVTKAQLREDRLTIALQVSGLPASGSCELGIRDLLNAASHPVPTTLAPMSRVLPVQLPGLRVAYFLARELSHVTSGGVVPAIDFAEGPKPHTEYYAAQYTGWLTAPTTGDYSLALSSDDGGRLYVDDHLLVDQWSDHPCQTGHAHLVLMAGVRHRLRVDYFQGATDECLRLAWALPGQQEQPIPASAFSHDTSDVR